ncbi:YebC/PmpR family DNA-binding transcriptional regulator [Oceanotoga teriensis]|jgi:YebC/PmpR family DNA-binding regulatory protein|uniref:YebC/PmpR family DNA-binding transcriptional regulator n=1 Tax=Oceanotoga teriensis TaxID=515440 RepID=UPI0027142D63|nr:YebC/PmpR family DNA-binding transcriptional regulator [Oceanotoga teriensis]MDO7975669.1 YebC/PmpR family DNA-binding transcriptional regulator [Oceanotoga teriensis]
MSGHNKWANIKHRKGAQDAKRSKAFTKIIREITIAARDGGGDADANPRLRSAVDKAKAANMPKDKIETAIKKGTGELEGEELTELLYEGYGPAGVALLISVVTDNKNRSAQEIRHLLSKGNGSLAEAGAVSWNFERKGLIKVPKEEVSDMEEFMMQAIEAGAEDITEDTDPIEITVEPDLTSEVREALKADGYSIEDELTYNPKTTVNISGNDAEKLLKLLDNLEDNDDVQQVFGNYDIDDAELEELSKKLG